MGKYYGSPIFISKLTKKIKTPVLKKVTKNSKNDVEMICSVLSCHLSYVIKTRKSSFNTMFTNYIPKTSNHENAVAKFEFVYQVMQYYFPS